jgi:hypothetical protein
LYLRIKETESGDVLCRTCNVILDDKFDTVNAHLNECEAVS